ncbi:MAG: hypothetical protein P8170_20475 [Gemmatimonadota bacterium]
MHKAPTFENALDFAAELIRIPGLPGEEGAVAERLRQEMVDLGLEDVRVDEAGNVIGVARGRGSAPSAMLNCPRRRGGQRDRCGHGFGLRLPGAAQLSPRRRGRG